MKKILAVFFVLVFAAALALPAAADNFADSSGVEYSYSRQCFYSKPYIFEIGWNISEKSAGSLDSKKITLSDKTAMTVWYNGNSDIDMSGRELSAALADVLERIKSEKNPVTRPAVLVAENVGNASPDELCGKYYKNDDIAYFAAVFPFAGSSTQQSYLKKAYDDDDAAFFSVGLDNIGSDGIAKRYLAKSYTDDNIALFSISFNYLEDSLSDRSFDKLINIYAEKAYEDEKTDFFAVLSGEMDSDTLEAWYNRASKDRRADFKIICDYDDNDDDRDDFDDWDWDWD